MKDHPGVALLRAVGAGLLGDTLVLPQSPSDAVARLVLVYRHPNPPSNDNDFDECSRSVPAATVLPNDVALNSRGSPLQDTPTSCASSEARLRHRRDPSWSAGS